MSELLQPADDAAIRDYSLLRDACGRVDLSAFCLVELTGDDRKGWLQGQVTNDLRRFEGGVSTAFCLTEPTGHLISVMDGWALADRILLTMPRETRDGFMKRVEQMVVLEDVVARDVTDAYQVVSVQGPYATREVSDWVQLPSLDAGVATVGEESVITLRSNRTGMGGWDLWIANPALAEEFASRFSPISPEAFDVARLESGIPAWGSDMGPRTLPPELGSAFESRHVNYNKGCYTGQEVLQRMHSRGHTNRTWMGLLADAPLEIGATVAHRLREDAGVVTSAGFSPDYGYIGAAMLRNEAAGRGEVVTVRTEQGAQEAEVAAMPILRFD